MESSEKGWVISEHSNPADIKNWEELLCEGESKVAEFFDGEDIVILDVIKLNILIEALQIKRSRTLDSLPKNEDICQRKYTFWKCILR